jgi:hypothetical protein
MYKLVRLTPFFTALIIADVPYRLAKDLENCPWDKEPLSTKELVTFIKGLKYINLSNHFVLVVFCAHEMYGAYKQVNRCFQGTPLQSPPSPLPLLKRSSTKRKKNRLVLPLLLPPLLLQVWRLCPSPQAQKKHRLHPLFLHFLHLQGFVVNAATKKFWKPSLHANALSATS